MKKKERLFRAAVKASMEATSVKIDKTGELYIRAPWARDTEAGGWYWVGAADDVGSDLLDTETNGNGKVRLENRFNPAAEAYREYFSETA